MKFKDALDAYAYVLSIIEKMVADGIVVKMKPHCSRKNRTLVEEYKNDTERIPEDNWVNVQLFPQSSEHVKRIFDETQRLRDIGIGFDTGGDCEGGRDWELDWSFYYSSSPLLTSKKAHSELEKMLNAEFKANQQKIPTA